MVSFVEIKYYFPVLLISLSLKHEVSLSFEGTPLLFPLSRVDADAHIQGQRE